MALIDKASLLMVPSTYEDGTLYNVLPSGNKAPDETGNNNAYDQTRADFTFSRGSNLAATRRNSSGLIEKGRENLLLQSNSFSTSPWDNQLGVGGSVTSGQLGYDGSNNAWLIEKNTTSFRRIQQSVSTSGVFTYSIYAKAGTTSIMNLRAVSASTERVEFDLSDGTIVFNQNEIDAKIEAVGTNGWYRCSITRNEAITMVQIYVEWNQTIGGKNIYIQDAQLEAGLVATDYIETGATTATAGVLENTPRIDYSSGAGALLLEPGRTNIIESSEYFQDDYWANLGIHEFDTNTTETTSPLGDYSATKIVADTSSSNNHNIYGDVSLSSGTQYAVSIFAKAAEYDYLFIRGLGLGASGGARFNIATGVVEGVAGYDSATIEDYGNGWYRCIAIGTSISTTAPYYHMSPTANFSPFAGNDSDGIYIFGAQCEAASYPSSYVPTYGSAATRGAELCKKTDINDVIGGTQGTIFFDVTMSESLTNTNYKQFFYYTDSGGTNQTYMYVSNTNYIVGNPNLGNIISSTQMEAGQRYKIAVTYATNSFKMYVNGSQDATSSSGTPKDNENIISIGSYNGTSEFNEFTFNQYIHFKEVLSDSELATLTTL